MRYYNEGGGNDSRGYLGSGESENAYPGTKTARKIVTPFAILTSVAVIYLRDDRSDSIETIGPALVSLVIVWGIILLVS